MLAGETRVLLCAIVKNENLYLREFVEYYKNLGVTHIIINDNNDIFGEHPEYVIGDYVESGYVDVVDYRGVMYCQFFSYNRTYAMFGAEYDWIMFFDCDEFLWLKNKNVQEYLSQDKFSTFNAILVNWRLYTDNCELYYKEGNVIDRFPTPIPDNKCISYGFPENDHVKTILRGGLRFVNFMNPHYVRNRIKSCNSIGEPVANGFHVPYVFDEAYLKHYRTKSTEEYIWKCQRGYPDIDRPNYEKFMINNYFGINELTEEKRRLFLELTGVDVLWYFNKS
jgi:hypothetical protein